MATDELARVEYQMNVTTNESVAATRRILETAAETEQVGNKTVNKLEEQGERLQRIGCAVDEVREVAQDAEHETSKLDSCGWCCRCCGLRRSNVRNKPTPRLSDQVEVVVTAQPVARTQKRKEHKGPYIKRVLEDDDREQEIDDNLRATDAILCNIQDLAVGMARELDKQNEFIPKLSENTQGATDRIEEVTDHLKDHL